VIGVGGIQSFVDELFHMGRVSVSMVAKDPSSRRDFGLLKWAEADTGTNAIELGLAVRDEDVLVRVKAQEDGDEEGRVGIVGKPEAIKVGTELGEGGAQGGTKFQYQGFIREGLSKGEEGNGRVHLEELIHEVDQGLAVTGHHIFACKFCIWDHQVKVEEVLVRVWARQEGGLGVLGSSRGLGWERSCWGKGGLGGVHLHS